MERRIEERQPTALPIKAVTVSGSWAGTCINLSSEGALLRLNTQWEDAEEFELHFESVHPSQIAAQRARVVRVSSPDQHGSFLAVRFVAGS